MYQCSQKKKFFFQSHVRIVTDVKKTQCESARELISVLAVTGMQGLVVSSSERQGS